MSQLARIGLTAGCLLSGALTTTLAQAAPRVQVRGSSQVELHATGPAHEVVLRGVLRDEVGAPIRGAAVVLQRLADSGQPQPWQSIEACSGHDGVPGPHQDHPVVTDDAGQFCARAMLAGTSATVRALFGGDALHEGTQADVRWDAARLPVTLRFSPRPDRINLDAASVNFFALLHGPDDDALGGRVVHLVDDRGKALQQRTTDGAGQVHFDVPTLQLGEPGIGSIGLRFDGTPDLMSAQATAAVTRVMGVRLVATQPVWRGDPRQGLALGFTATTARGPAQGGLVEVRGARGVVGSAAVRDGHAEVFVRFEPHDSERKAELSALYVADAPYYEAHAPVPVVVEVTNRSVWLRLVPLALGSVVALWLLRGWRRPKRRALAPLQQASVAGVAVVEVLGPSADASTWEGRIIDAHDGSPIEHASVRVVAPGFVELDVLASVRTGDDGCFKLKVKSSQRELRLQVEAPLHQTIDQALPAASQMVVALVSRRRALLERLVQWASRAGRPWHELPEPTPGHVARVAGRQRIPSESVRQWAEQVQRRAYGPEPVDAAAERQTQALEPSGQPLR